MLDNNSKNGNSKKSKEKIPVFDVEWSYLVGLLILFIILLLRVYLDQPLLALDHSYSFLLPSSSTDLFSLLLKPFLFLGEYVVFVSCLLGLISLFLFQKIIELTKTLKKKYLFYANLLFIINPLFISTFSTLNRFILIIPSVLFLIFLTLKTNVSKKKSNLRSYEPLLTTIFILLLSLISFEATLMAVILIIYLAKEKSRKIGYFIVACFALFLATYFSTLHYDLLSETKQFAELGSTLVPSLFLLILGLLSFQKMKDAYLKLGVAILVISYFFLAESRWFLSIIMVYFSAHTILYFNKRDWILNHLKKATLLLVYCSLLFVLLSSLVLQINSSPSKELELASNNLGNFVIAPESLRNSIKYFSGSKVISKKSNSLVDQLYYAVRTTKAEELMNTMNAGAILLTKDLKQEVWTHDDQGLLLILEISDDFRKVYSGNDVELWLYSPSAASISDGDGVISIDGVVGTTGDVSVDNVVDVSEEVNQ